MTRQRSLRVSRENAYVVRAAESRAMRVPAKSIEEHIEPTQRDIALARAVLRYKGAPEGKPSR